ncbi:MAG: S9 family peptidase [Candidatus Eremiobacteraeota bacterium]|nr:S9 family peptidase [Candidatus Eremiobacteraeota bacterium]
MQTLPRVFAVAFVAAACCGALPAAAQQAALIPRSVLFGSPVKALPKISPDGTHLAYLAPKDGKLAIWVRTIGKEDDRLVASDPNRPIRTFYWQPDSKHILYEQDKNGDENFQVFQVDVNGANSRDLTPFDGVRSGLDAVENDIPNTVLMASNKRDKRVFDEYRLDLTTGELTMLAENPGDYQGFIADRQLRVRAAQEALPDGSTKILVRDGDSGPFRVLATFSADDGFPSPQAFSADGKTLYVISSTGANAARLLAYDVATGKSTVVASDPTYDVGEAIFDPKTKALIGAGYQRDRQELQFFDPAYQADYAAIRSIHPGDIDITSATRDGNKLIVTYINDDQPVWYYAYDRTTKRGTALFSTRPALEKYTLAKMQPVTYPARDGLAVHGYLTLPVGVPPKNLPMVLFVHGGPWARDTWGYNPYAQWLANRGYAVLAVNYRGSTGYGKNFMNAGDRQWAGTMRTDLLDAVAWAVKQGYADPKKVAIMGGSYGGYATLAALAFSPTAFAVGVDIVGPSNLNTLLASIPPYWETMKSMFTRRMGDTEAFLDSQSPLFKADQIVAPLLIGQGAHDPRVNQRESDQIVAAMRKNGKPVEYIVFPDEGHGFANPQNNLRFNAAAEAFLAKYLGGRDEPAAPDENVTAFLK